MGFNYAIPIISISTAASVLVQQAVVMAQVNEQTLAALTKDVTVVINGQNPGSGVIIAHQGNTYSVLTAKHVIPRQDEYEIVTADGRQYILDYSTVRKLPDLDLVVVQFTSSENYQVAVMGNSEKVTEGTAVYIAGWPHPGRAITQRIFQLYIVLV